MAGNTIPVAEDDIIGWTVMTGNPAGGLTLYGNFSSNEEAASVANNDPHLDDYWWVVPIYAMGE